MSEAYPSTYRHAAAVWSGFLGLFFRKFFWDFVGGTLRDTGGLQWVSTRFRPFTAGTLRSYRPSPKASVFIALIVTIPAVQTLTMILGFFIIALEYPLPLLKHLAIQRSIILRVVVLVLQAFVAILFYQVRTFILPPCGYTVLMLAMQGTDPSLWSLLAACCYIWSLVLKEKMTKNRENDRENDEHV
jgi:hypothetical protein